MVYRIKWSDKELLNKGEGYPGNELISVCALLINGFSVPACLFWSHQKEQMCKVGPIKRSRLDRFLYKPFHLLSGLCT